MVEQTVHSAIRNDAFQFLKDKIVRSSSAEDSDLQLDLSATTAAAPSLAPPPSPERTLDPAYRLHLLAQVDRLVANFISRLAQVLRKIKHREEDVLAAANGPAARFLSRSAAAPPVSAPKARTDVETLFYLVAAIYRDSPPDSGLKYWMATDADQRLTKFLLWATDARTFSMQKALLEMLASLSVGPFSSMAAYNFLCTGEGSAGPVDGFVCSWDFLIGALQSNANQLPKVNEAVQASQGMVPVQSRQNEPRSTLR